MLSLSSARVRCAVNVTTCWRAVFLRRDVELADNAVDLLPSFQSLEQKVSASANELGQSVL